MIADKVIKFLAFNLIGKEDADFVYNHYNPVVAKSLRDIKTKIPTDEIIKMAKMSLGMIMKIGYSFAFQEEMPPIPFLWKPIPNEIGGLLLPAWNKLASDISGVP